MFAEIKRWGNSLAVRLPKRELDRLGVAEGERVLIRVEKLPEEGPVDLSDLPTFQDHPDASDRHDELLYGDG
jgi:hypothetical protein